MIVIILNYLNIYIFYIILSFINFIFLLKY